MDILLDGLFFNGSGFAEDNYMILQCLNVAGVNIKIIPRDTPVSNSTTTNELQKFILPPNRVHLYEGDVYICNIMVGSLRYNPNFKINIARTMFETNYLLNEWVDNLNNFDEVWVASTFNRDSFIRAGVLTPIYIVPSIVDYNEFTIQGKTYPIPFRDKYTFLSIFDWQPRKGPFILLQAYLEEFTPEDNVCLLIKTYTLSTNRDPLFEIDHFMQQICKSDQFTSPIYVINSSLIKSELIQLYRASDAFVLPTRGEGWCRPLFESMVMGIPTIGTNWGGQTEFMNLENSYPVGVESLETIENSEFAIFNGHQWAKPSLNDLRSKMRYVYEHQKEAQAIAESGQAKLRETYSLQICAKLITQRLNYLKESK